MKYISVCSGIEAASVAWSPLGWKPVAFAEIDAFPSAVLAHHYPDVPNLGDITKVNWSEYHGKANVVIGGTPCQAFSLAGNRKGIADERGQLTLKFVEILQAVRPEWFIWENVPGVLSTNGGKDFACFLGAISNIGYSYAYRILDAQHFGVPQRRRRIFLVGHIADWRRAAKVLFESESLQGDIKASGGKGQSVARKTERGVGETIFDEGIGFETYSSMCPTLRASHAKQPPVVYNETGHSKFKAEEVCGTLRACGGTLSGGSEALVYESDVSLKLHCGYKQKEDGLDVANTLLGHGHRIDYESENFILYENHQLDARIKEVSIAPTVISSWDNMSSLPLVYENNPTDGRLKQISVCPTVLARYGTGGGQVPLVQNCIQANTIRHAVHLSNPNLIRRLTPLECERLQGFPDNFTRIPYRNKAAENCPDSPRYKAIGNSMCVNVVRWIGQRIQGVNDGNV